jgi:uracil-DNA glycosylase family 4
MLVGEAPGAREDDIARPFSGVAGQYLDRMLSEAGLSRDDLYITNTVRCRPPDNRTPTKAEIKACSTYMLAEIEAVNPEHILLLGNVSLQGLLGTSGVMAKRGTVQNRDGRNYFITIHPAAVLRNPSLESQFRSDLQAFARLSQGNARRPETHTKLIRTATGLGKLLTALAEVTTPIAFDAETDSLNPWEPGTELHTLALSWIEGESWVIALEHPETKEKWDIPLSRVYEAIALALEGKKMVGHNAKFDGKWMIARNVPLYLHFDTMLASHLLDENRPKGLKPLARQYLGAEEWEAGITFGVGRVTPLRQLAIYNGKDADYTLRLYHIFRDELKKRPKLARLYMKLTMPACRAFMTIEGHGFPVDMERLETRDIEIKEKIEGIRQKMLTYVPKGQRESANFRSPIFLGQWLFGTLELPILLVTPKSNRPSTSESALLQLRKMHPAVDLLMELRKWEKYESTYTRNWRERVGLARKPRLFTTYNLAGTVTGRLSSDMQQVPRDLLIRTILGSEPGWDFVESDFSQVELRIAAMFSGDAALTNAFRSGGDPHTETASSVLGIPQDQVTKDQRKMAKAVNFGFLYGMGARKFKIYADEKYGVTVTDEEAKAYRDAFFKKYASLQRWHERCRRLVHNLQQVQSPIGRVRHLPGILSTDDYVVGEAERDAINSPVQGFASDMTVLSMVILQSRLDPERARIVGNVHDAILFEVREDYTAEAVVLIKEVMEHLPLKQLFGFSPTVPIKVDCTVSKHWGEK